MLTNQVNENYIPFRARPLRRRERACPGQNHKYCTIPRFESSLLGLQLHMAGLVTVQPGGKRFSVDGSETVLEAALRAGLALDYGCSNGNCGLCLAQVLSGDAERVKPHDFVISDTRREQGQILMCAYTVRGDAEILATEATGAGDIPRQEIDARMKKLTRLAGDTWLLHLQTPRTRRLRFLAGQSALLSFADTHLSLPIASCPCDDRNIEFHVQMTTPAHWRESLMALKTGDSVRIDGPVGDFHLQDGAQRPRVFLAFDGGFAPIKSLVEHAMQLEHQQPHYLYWFAVDKDSHYMNNQMRSWADAFDNFHYAPRSATASGKPDVAPVFAELARQGISLATCEIYVAGPRKYAACARDAALAAGCEDRYISVNALP
jgi:CDP-4-dehydro-6-deoxyglucose reductase